MPTLACMAAMREGEVLDRTDGGAGHAQADQHHPFISPETRMREFSVRAVIMGTILGMIFGASSLYLVLKVGITVSASIPVAVISITLFRLLSKIGIKDATILEHNIVQTAGSAGESLAFGVGVTMPAIMILGFDLEVTRVALVAVLGGLLGVLMMIPLRRALIVQQHTTLKYPEGTACAEVLKAGASAESLAMASPEWRHASSKQRAVERGTSAATIFAGFGIGLVYNVAMQAFRLWKNVPEKLFGPWFKGASVGAEITPELLGIGYIIGTRISCIMAAGGVLSYLVLIPMIKFFGDALPQALAPGSIPIFQMGPNDIRGAYILYIGAGAVAAGGIISLIRSLPLIWHGIREGLRDVGANASQAAAGVSRLRTEDDLPMKLVFGGIIALIVAITVAPKLHMNIMGAILIVAFGFLFVTVSSRLTGEIGSSSNPISGMTVATLLLTSLVFLALGWTEPGYYVTALSVGAIVCIASSNGGTISQDLKTGYLIGSTPRYQQIAILFGVLASALMLGPILLKLNDNATVFVPVNQPELKTEVTKLPQQKQSLHGPQAAADKNSYYVWQRIDPEGGPAKKYLVNNAGQAVYLVDPGINGTVLKRPDGSDVRKFEAPKATLMSYIIKGILDRKLPWGLVLLGVMISVVLELCGVGSLAFAVGVYLPLSTSAPVFIGGVVRWIVDRRRRVELAHRRLTEEQLAADADRSPGVLCASGYIAGGAIAGIVIAILAGALEEWDAKFAKLAEGNPFFTGPNADALALIPFLGLIVFLYLVARENVLSSKETA
ncbi:MAG TPA: oligopeptide transporter, OPT family [Verrucomicrobiae bacterium]|nr:oligopeptide transporter, OPT family [Verrucomicrobiae bacterium]